MQFSVNEAQNKDNMCTMQELISIDYGIIESKTVDRSWWSFGFQCWFIENIHVLDIILVQYIYSYIYHNHISILQLIRL